MTDLHPLIRVQRHALEQKQKFLAELYRQAEEMQAQKDTLLKQMAQEREKVKELGVEMLSYFGPYSEAVKDRVADIDAALVQLDKRIEFAREEMRAAFAELKKIEITQEAREDEQTKEVEKKETQELDEIALETYRRKQSES